MLFSRSTSKKLSFWPIPSVMQIPRSSISTTLKQVTSPPPPQSLESMTESEERLHSTAQSVFTALLKYPVPVPSSLIPLFRSAFFESIHEVVQTGHLSALFLVVEIANKLPWDTLALSSTEAMQLSSLVRKLLSEAVPKDVPETKSHLDSILMIWVTLSMK